MTTDASTATNPTPNTTDTTGAEKRRDTEAMAPPRGEADDLPDAFQPRPNDKPIEGSAGGRLHDYIAEGYNTALEATDAASLYRERNRLRAALDAIANERLSFTVGHGAEDALRDRINRHIRAAREALQGSEST